jgi:hypothetical protein
VATLIDSRQKELEDLGRALFWGSNPTREDYNALHRQRGGITTPYTPDADKQFEYTKKDCIKRMCGQETYESIYGKESIGQDIHNAS